MSPVSRHLSKTSLTSRSAAARASSGVILPRAAFANIEEMVQRENTSSVAALA